MREFYSNMKDENSRSRANKLKLVARLKNNSEKKKNLLKHFTRKKENRIIRVPKQSGVYVEINDYNIVGVEGGLIKPTKVNNSDIEIVKIRIKNENKFHLSIEDINNAWSLALESLENERYD